jgi:uncharacterized protein YukE
MNGDSGESSDRMGEPLGTSALQRSAARCRALADHIRDSLIQDLAAEALTLEVAARGDLAHSERDALQAMARMVQRCARFLGAVADRLESASE